MWWIADAGADEIDELIGTWVRDPAEVRRLHDVLDREAAAVEADLAGVGETAGAGDALRRAVIGNLVAKRDAAEPFAMSPGQIEREVIGYEAFKLESYVTSGVFPKRYFGYLDGRRDTAAHEVRLRATVTAARRACNVWLAEQGDDLRVTDAELAVTFLAESGALYMGAQTDRLERLHPVFDVGLDDLASGDNELGGLRDRLDAALGTDLRGMVAWTDDFAIFPVPTLVDPGERWLQSPHGAAAPHPYLVRYMTFEEAIAGTALMWVWEKRLARDAIAVKLADQPLDLQFIVGSLVYNSGKAHTPAKWELIRTFGAAAWMYKASEDNAVRRWRLPVLPAVDALDTLRAGGTYPDQGTAWLGGYHILQRYGAWVALHRFTDTFDAEDSFLPTPAAPDPAWFPVVEAAIVAPPPVVQAAAVAVEPSGCGCATGGEAGIGLVAGLIALARRGRGTCGATGSRSSRAARRDRCS